MRKTSGPLKPEEYRLRQLGLIKNGIFLVATIFGTKKVVHLFSKTIDNTTCRLFEEINPPQEELI